MYICGKNYALQSTKIFNDPVYGFISVSDEVILKLIDHPYFQRLRRIGQTGLSYLVYPGAKHTRFHHALGAMHLMQRAIRTLREKGSIISKEEERAAQIAILLHDIGHGPFSHTLENTLIENYSHEQISAEIMQILNQEMNGKLDEAIAIFKNNHPKTYLHKLVSGQLDVDRLDYLMRDSFFTGVAEGVIGSKRIIKMMREIDNELVVEEKGIYSIEKFLIARRLMYWQVYLHKTVLGAETILLNILKRAKYLALQNEELFGTTSLRRFLNEHKAPFLSNDEKIKTFTLLDDSDVISAIKEWQFHSDFVLSNLCQRLLNRNLFKVKLQKENFQEEEIEALKNKISAKYQLKNEELNYFINQGKVSNTAYDAGKDEIKFALKNGKIKTIFEVSEHLEEDNTTKRIEKNYICYPKDL